jgi:hypothetical protein
MFTEPSIPLSINDWREELQKERKKCEDLQNSLKNQERNYQKLVGELKTQLQAEQQKSLSLENSLQKIPFTMSQVQELQAQLKQQELKQRSLIEQHNHRIQDLDLQLKEAISNNLSSELAQFKDFAMNEITEKEKVIIEQKLIIEKSEEAIRGLSQEIEYAQSLLLSEQLKYTNKIEALTEKIEDLEEEIREMNDFKEMHKDHHNKHLDEANKHAKASDENRDMKLKIENLLEELELKDQDLKNAEKKINQLRENRLSLAENIRSLEIEVEKLQAEKDEISKGLENKDEKIQLLEEEIYSNAEGISDHYKEELVKSNEKCKKLEKCIRDIEENFENQLEDKLALVAQAQLKINELIRKIASLEKDKEGFAEKLQKAYDEQNRLENKLNDYKTICDRESEKVKEKLKDKITSLKNERDELRMKINELQEASSFNRPSVLDCGGSLFDELAQLPEGRFSRISVRSTVNEDNKRIDGLIAQVAEKETVLKNLNTERNHLEVKLKETMTEVKNLQGQLSISIKHSQQLSQELEMAKWELDSLRSDEGAKLDKGKILVLESEKELLVAEKSRLETELVLSKENWAELNNSLYKDLLEAQTSAAQAKSELLMFKENNLMAKNSIEEEKGHKKKRSIGSWFGKKN